MAFAAILVLCCVAALLLVAAVVAMGLQKWALAASLGLPAVILIVVFAILVWQAYAVWHPTPHHFQDLDHIPDVAGVGDYAPQLRQVAVDHVYYYNTRTLRSNQFFRCHIIHKADFETYRRVIRCGAPSKWSEREKNQTVKWLGEEFKDYKTIASWWDWPNRAAREVICLDKLFIVVFDEANSTVYIAREED